MCEMKNNAGMISSLLARRNGGPALTLTGPSLLSLPHSREVSEV